MERMVLMKKIFSILLIFAMALALTACGEKYTLEASDIRVNLEEVEAVSMNVIEGTLSSTEVTVEMVNLSNMYLASGNEHDFFLQVEKDGVWYTLVSKEDLVNTTEALVSTPGSEMQFNFNWEDRYGQLESGHYRVVKSFCPEEDYSEQYHLAVEFDL